MGKFELFMGCLGNGITVCNKAVQENGDYKHIAHISNAGMIHFYVPLTYIPEDSMEKIRKAAAEERCKFTAYWNSLTEYERYGRLLDHANCVNLVKIFKNKASLSATIRYAETLLVRQENDGCYFFY